MLSAGKKVRDENMDRWMVINPCGCRTREGSHTVLWLPAHAEDLEVSRHPLPPGAPDHLATRTLAYTHSSSLGSAICRGLSEILIWPYSTSSSVFCGTFLAFRMFTSAYVNSCSSFTCVEPWPLLTCRFLCTQTTATASMRRISSAESTPAIVVICAPADEVGVVPGVVVLEQFSSAPPGNQLEMSVPLFKVQLTKTHSYIVCPAEAVLT